jgi:hypothetical protein
MNIEETTPHIDDYKKMRSVNCFNCKKEFELIFGYDSSASLQVIGRHNEKGFFNVGNVLITCPYCSCKCCLKVGDE